MVEKQKENMGKKLVLVGALVLGAALVAPVHASLVVNYTVDPVAAFNVGDPGQGYLDRIALTGVSDSLTLQAGVAQTAPINGLVWWVGNSPVPNGTPVSFTLLRNISLNAGGSTVIQQGVDTYYDYVNHLSVSPGLPLVFSFPTGTVTVTPIGYEMVDKPGVNYYMPPSYLEATFLFTPVPEPTTMVAGSMLLLPFGASTLRMLRRKQTS